MLRFDLSEVESEHGAAYIVAGNESDNTATIKHAASTGCNVGIEVVE